MWYMLMLCSQIMCYAHRSDIEHSHGERRPARWRRSTLPRQSKERMPALIAAADVQRGPRDPACRRTDQVAHGLTNVAWGAEPQGILRRTRRALYGCPTEVS